MEEMDWELISFQMITAAGEAKSNYMEALLEAKEKNFERAEELMKEGEKSFVQVHDAHAGLVQRECAGEKVEVSLLMAHVEDQMMSVEVIKILVIELYEIYKKLDKLAEVNS